uniref:NADH dehydrogenase subunit 2 n=1 Tax=Teredo bartschi TaxID=2939325 RepID=UPI002027A339|nr:NADH dehydrogenase subunit 2 [Teredo bartschi]UPX89294.1 NADH dehydrogenase subunit 2 [Teredo bartschi]
MGSVSSFSRLTPAFSFFMFLSVLGVLMVLASGGLLGIYVGFECSFLGLAAILSGDSVEENESCMKYFVFQALGSLFMLFGFMMMIEPIMGHKVPLLLTLVGVCLKGGFFPFHFWVPSVMSTCSWFSCFLVAVWQKVGLMCFIGKWGLSYTLTNYLELVALVTAILGAFGGVWVIYYRALMGYSSLVHSGWMLMAAMCSLPSVMFYMFVYGVISGILMRRLYKLKIMCFEDFSNFHHHEAGSVFMVFLDFMSLGGLPVLPGFLPKVVVLIMMGLSKKIGMFFLIISSVISLFYYLKVAMVAGVGSGLNYYLVHKWSGSLSKGSMFKKYIILNAGLYFIGMVGLLVLVGVMS